MAHLRRLLVGFTSLAMAAASGYADIVPGADSRIANATAILLVHVPTPEEARLKRPAMPNYWIVDEVFKGIETRHYIPRSQNSGVDAPAGAKGLVFRQLRESSYLSITTEETPAGDAEVLQWLSINQDDIQLLVQPDQGIKGGRGDGLGPLLSQPLPLETLRQMINPDDANLQPQLLDALFFPEKFAELARKDAPRAAYIRLRLALSDLGRDGPALANLLEWPDMRLRVTVAQRLSKLTGARLAVPAAVDAASWSTHAQQWRDWWAANRAQLVWREAADAFGTRPAGQDPIAERWPPLPNPLVMPPEPLSAAVKKTLAPGIPDPDAFAAAMRAFIDGGAQRDAALLAASNVKWWYEDGEPQAPRPARLQALLQRTAKNTPGMGISLDELRGTPDGLVMRALFPNCMFGGSGPYLAPAPVLDSQLILDAEVPVDIRWRVIANYIRYAHGSEFVAQRQAVLAALDKRPLPHPEYLRRAAFWEPYADYPQKTIAENVILRLRDSLAPDDQKFIRDLMQALPDNALAVRSGTLALQKSGTPEDQRKLVALYLANPRGEAGAAVFYAAKAGQQVLLQLLIEDLKTSKGERFRRTAEHLTSAHVDAANPVIASRLSDTDDAVRQAAARHLTFNVTREIEPALLAAWDKEKLPAVRQELIQALSHVQDPRALDILLASTREKWPENHIYTAIAMGLRTFNDPKALPPLADLTVTYRDDNTARQVVNEALISFGAISKLYAVPQSAPGVWQPHNIDPALQAQALPIIDQWRKDHTAKINP